MVRTRKRREPTVTRFWTSGIGRMLPALGKRGIGAISFRQRCLQLAREAVR